MLKKFPLSRRILFAFSTIFLLLILLICIFLNTYIRSDVIRQDLAHQNVYASSLAQQTQTLLDEMNRISVLVYYSKNITEAFSGSLHYDGSDNYFSKHIQASEEIESGLYSIVGTDITEIIVNLYNDKCFYSSKYYPVNWQTVRQSMEAGHLSNVTAALAVAPDPIITHIDNAYWTLPDYAQHRYISLSRRFLNYTTRKDIGRVEVLMPEKFIQQLYQGSSPGQMTLLLGANNQVLYASEMENENYAIDIDKFLKSYHSAGDHRQFSAANGKTYYYGVSNLEKYGLSVISLQWHNPKDYMEYSVIIAIAGILMYSLSLGLCALVSWHLSKPMNRIVTSLRENSWDKLEMKLNLDSRYGDFDVLEESYSAMMVKLHESINLVIDSHLNEQRATYLALQSQISPHFIYNTIANISACAYENGIYKIVEICDKLCGLLRYATDYTDELSDIASELEYTENYLELMKVRYEDHFFYSITCAEECANVHIPRLITQTVIENCFKHSFKEVPAPWFIAVAAYAQDGWWLIDITHNGNAISQEQLAQILDQTEQIYEDVARGLKHMNLGGLGLLNSITRLKMLCDNEFCFEVFSADASTSTTRFGGRLK